MFVLAADGSIGDEPSHSCKTGEEVEVSNRKQDKLLLWQHTTWQVDYFNLLIGRHRYIVVAVSSHVTARYGEMATATNCCYMTSVLTTSQRIQHACFQLLACSVTVWAETAGPHRWHHVIDMLAYRQRPHVTEATVCAAFIISFAKPDDDVQYSHIFYPCSL